VFKVGLTGGIGCGKSTVSKLFSDLDVPVIDADDIAHALVEPGQPALSELSKAFGNDALNPEGTLNRAYLRAIVFTDPLKKQQLEGILHPLVYATMQEKIQHLENPYCILSIPLLFETRMIHFVDRVLVVDCPVETQIARVKLRNNLSEAKIRPIIDSQVSREYRLKHADDVIDNTGTGDKLAEQAKKLHNLYLSISAR
jgi:dephospho-CoA kinase